MSSAEQRSIAYTATWFMALSPNRPVGRVDFGGPMRLIGCKCNVS